MKALPRDGGGHHGVRSCRRVKGGAEVLRMVAQARVEVASKKAYAALLALDAYFSASAKLSREAVLQFANKWQKSPITESGSPAEFLEYLAYFREAGGTVALASSDEDDSVKLMTAHSAKGLEFDHVFILRAVRTSFPSPYHEPLIEIPAELRNSESAADRDEKEVHKQEETAPVLCGHDPRPRHADDLWSSSDEAARQDPSWIPARADQASRLKNWLKERICRKFQTDIFGEDGISAVAIEANGWICRRPRIWRQRSAQVPFSSTRPVRCSSSWRGVEDSVRGLCGVAVWGVHASGAACVLPVGAGAAPEIRSRTDRTASRRPGRGRLC